MPVSFWRRPFTWNIKPCFPYLGMQYIRQHFIFIFWFQHCLYTKITRRSSQHTFCLGHQIPLVPSANSFSSSPFSYSCVFVVRANVSPTCDGFCRANTLSPAASTQDCPLNNPVIPMPVHPIDGECLRKASGTLSPAHRPSFLSTQRDGYCFIK